MNLLLASVQAFVNDAAVTLDAFMETLLWAIVGPALLISVGLSMLRNRIHYSGTPRYVRWLPLAQRTVVGIMVLVTILWMASSLWVDHLNAVAGYDLTPWRNAESVIAFGALVLVGAIASLIPGEFGQRNKLQA